MSDYEKIRPSVFAGPAVWHTLYCYASDYNPKSQKDVDEMKTLIYLLLKRFPCKTCSRHALATYKMHNIDNYLQNRDRLYLYISAILHEGANDHKKIPMEDRPAYYHGKKFIFQSMTGTCERCQ